TEAQVFAARAVPSLSSIGTYRLEFRGHGIHNLAESLRSPLHGARGNFAARGNTGSRLGRLRYGGIRTWARELGRPIRSGPRAGQRHTGTGGRSDPHRTRHTLATALCGWRIHFDFSR